MQDELTILRQLAREVDSILKDYSYDKLKRPILQLYDSVTRNGDYSYSENIIRMNRKMVLNSPWRVTMEILKHELAHHVADHIFGGLVEVAHGAAFKLAAQSLALCDRATRATCDLIKLENDLGDEQSKILARAEKLESLSKSDNAHEAALALRRLQELQAKHDVESWKLEQKVEVSFTFVSFGGSRKKPTWAAGMGNMLIRVYGVYAVFTHQYSPKTGRYEGGFEFIGSPSSLEAVEYAWDFIVRNMKSAYKKSGLKGRGNANSFYRAFIEGVGENMQQQEVAAQTASTEEQASDAQAIVLIKQEIGKKIIDLKNRRYKKLTTTYGSYRTNYGAAEAGHAAGRATQFSPGIRGGVKQIGA